jgi:hypothetical protein
VSKLAAAVALGSQAGVACSRIGLAPTALLGWTAVYMQATSLHSKPASQKQPGGSVGTKFTFLHLGT